MLHKDIIDKINTSHDLDDQLISDILDAALKFKENYLG